MVREIKFRVWNNVAKEMYYMHSPFWQDEYEILAFDGDMRSLGTSPLMQYTGLQDADGKDIYEGDILDVDNSGAIVEVTWFDDGWCVYDTRLNTEPWLERDYESLSPYARSSIIVGNIYENLELVKDES